MARSRFAGSRAVQPEKWAGGTGGTSGQQFPAEITTEDAVDVTDTTATLVATLDTKARPCFAYFRYNKVGGPSITTGLIAIAPSNTPTTVSSPVIGLDASSDYKVRAFAFQATGPFANQVVNGLPTSFQTQASTGGTVPTVNNQAPTSITATTCTLHASVNPNGLATIVDLWALDPIDNEFHITPVNIGSGTAFVDVSGGVAGLFSGQPHGALAKATNSAGAVNGIAIPFNVPPLSSGSPPTITASITNTIQPTSADVEVQFDTGSLICSVTIEWGLTVSYGSSLTINDIPPTQAAVQATIGPLVAANTYHWRATITNSAGSDIGDDVQFTTGAVGTPPTGRILLPTRIKDQSVHLHAEFNPQGTNTTVTFDIAETSNDLLFSGSTLVAGLPSVPDPGTGSVELDFRCVVNGLLPGKQYFYRAFGNNTGGQFVTAIGTFQTADAGVGTTPVSLTGQAALNIQTTQVTLSVAIDTGGESTSWYFEYWIGAGVKKNTKMAFIFKAVGELPAIEIMAATINNLLPNQAYNYRAAASNANDISVVFGATQVFSTLPAGGNPPATGTIHNATNIFATSATVTGTVTSTTAGTAAFQYTTDPTFVAGVVTTSPAFTVPAGSVGLLIPLTVLSPLVANTQYYVRAVFINDAGGNTSYSDNTIAFTTDGPQLPNVSTLPTPDVSDHTATLELSLTKVASSGDHFVKFGYSLTSSPTVSPNYDFFTPENNFGPAAGVIGYSYTVGLGGQNPPLAAATSYDFMAFARNDAGGVTGVERTFLTDPTPVGVFPDPIPSAPYNITATSFYVAGKVTLNGVIADVNFEWHNDTLGETPWTHSTPVQNTIPNVDSEGDDRTVAEQIHFVVNTMGNVTFGDTIRWRIKAVNANTPVEGVTVEGQQIQLAVLVPPATGFPTQTVNDTPFVQAMTTFMKDDTRAVIRTKVYHKGLRHWGQFEYTTNADWLASGARRSSRLSDATRAFRWTVCDR